MPASNQLLHSLKNWDELTPLCYLTCWAVSKLIILVCSNQTVFQWVGVDHSVCTHKQRTPAGTPDTPAPQTCVSIYLFQRWVQNVLVSCLCHFAKDTSDPNAQGVSNNVVKMRTWCVGFLALLLLCSLLEVANRRYLLHWAENFIKNKHMEPMVCVFIYWWPSAWLQVGLCCFLSSYQKLFQLWKIRGLFQFLLCSVIYDE